MQTLLKRMACSHAAGRLGGQYRCLSTASAEDLAKRIEASGHKQVKLSIADIDGVLRGKFVSAEKALSMLRGDQTLQFCSVIFGWDMADNLYDNGKFAGWHTGYPDITAKLDLSSYRELPWENNKPFFMLDFVQDGDHSKPLDVCPRRLLKTVKGQLASELNAGAYCGPELEWHNFKGDFQSMSETAYAGKPLSPGMFGYSLLRTGQNYEFFNRIFEDMSKFGVNIEGLHTETGPGVMEAAIKYTDPVNAADSATLFKYGVKIIGSQLGVFPNFMAKPSSSLPGNSGHLHQSLYDLTSKQNLFFEKGKDGDMSEMFRSYVAGQLLCLPQIMPMFCPTINSYKRLVEGFWAPVSATWGIENRTTSLRIIPGGPKATRIETRIGGSDANTYLSLAASLASGLYGIRNNLSLEDAVVGTKEVTPENNLPRSLAEATARMKHSKVAVELFGEGFVQHFTATREWEVKQYQTQVTDWELKRYAEII